MNNEISLPPSLLNNLQAAFVLHDASTKIINWNAKACELLGLSEQQILGKSALDPYWHFITESGQVLEQDNYPVNQVIATQKPLSDFIIGIISSRPKTVWVQVSAVPILNQASEIGHVFVTFMDVTLQIEAQKKLRESENQYRTVISAMHEGLIVQSQNGEIETCNPAAENILGLKASQLRGKKSVDPDWRSIHEDGSDFPGETHPAMVTLSTGKAQENVIMGVRKANNKPTWINVNTSPIFDNANSSPRAVISTFNDITSLKESQNTLIDNSRFLTTIIENAAEGLCVCHGVETFPFMKFTVWNSRMVELTGYTMEQINELGWYQSLYPDPEKQQNAIDRMNEMRTGNNLIHEEWEIVRADKQKRIFSISTRLVLTTPDQANVLALIQDVTDKRKAEKKLQDSEALFRGLVESSPIAMLVVAWDQNFDILHMNHQFTKIFGYTFEDMQNVSQWWPLAYPNQKYRDTVQNKWQERIEQANLEGQGRIHPMEANVTCKDGSVRNIEFHTAMVGNKGLVIFNDLTIHRKTEESLHLSASIIDSTSEGVMVTDTKLRILSVNRAFTEITGYSESSVIGETPSVLQSEKHDNSFYESMWASVKESGNWQGEIWNRRKDGELYPEWLTISRIHDEVGNVKNYVFVFSDISSVKQSEDQLYFLAHHDPLTELPNRFHIYGQIEQAILNAQRKNHLFAVVFIDLDRFKHINDSYGHHIGDVVLTTVAKRIRNALRQKDVVARIGGDEFIVLLDEVVDNTFLAAIAKKIINSIAVPIATEVAEFYLSASIGIAVYPDDGNDAATMISNADAAMYRAKDEGRNTFQYYSSDMTDAALERVTMESHLRQALTKGELGVEFQPVYNINTGDIIGAELLARWHDNESGYISPEKFIPLAEDNGLISELGTFVLHCACNLASNLHINNLAHIKLSVNMSIRQFQRPDVFSEIENILSNYQFPPSMLEFEITESLFAFPTDELIAILNNIRGLGISVTIDDFGTGFSSLAYLKQFPLDKLKIDRSFVSDIPEDENDMAIAKAIIALGHSLQLEIVAEGVETEAQRQFLIEQGCDYMQGYLYSKPLPIEEFEAILNSTMETKTDLAPA